MKRVKRAGKLLAGLLVVLAITFAVAPRSEAHSRFFFSFGVPVPPVYIAPPPPPPVYYYRGYYSYPRYYYAPYPRYYRYHYPRPYGGYYYGPYDRGWWRDR